MHICGIHACMTKFWSFAANDIFMFYSTSLLKPYNDPITFAALFPYDLLRNFYYCYKDVYWIPLGRISWCYFSISIKFHAYKYSILQATNYFLSMVIRSQSKLLKKVYTNWLRKVTIYAVCNTKLLSVTTLYVYMIWIQRFQGATLIKHQSSARTIKRMSFTFAAWKSFHYYWVGK